MTSVTLVEVAPRDGFQAVSTFIPTPEKIAAVEMLADAGFRRVEVGAFVSPAAIAQFADIADVIDKTDSLDGLRRQVLVPNRKGVALALAAGIRDLCWVVSVSESHNLNNVRCSVEQSLINFETAWKEFGQEVDFLRFNLATTFDCPFEGRVDEAAVVQIIERVLALVPKVEFGLCDTTGRAATDHVEVFSDRLLGAYGGNLVKFAFHGHDTYHLGIGNALAAYRAGLRVFDVAAAGLGGCPFAPGASGNTASEDLVFAFEHMGVSTGIDMRALLVAADRLAAIAPDQAGGRVRHVPRSRVLSGFGQNATGLRGDSESRHREDDSAGCACIL
ncbi:MAG: hydroxymethylglutaryl-CoA lyase [Hyphomicrobiaceae bacterium]